jgi:hypothetical protein
MKLVYLITNTPNAGYIVLTEELFPDNNQDSFRLAPDGTYLEISHSPGLVEQVDDFEVASRTSLQHWGAQLLVHAVSIRARLEDQE